LLKEFGSFLKEPHSKPLKGYKDLFELRVKQGSNIIRLFYFHHNSTLFIITSGYHKKEQKTDKRQILKAINLMNSYLEQNDEKN
jgi:phage-related protein